VHYEAMICDPEAEIRALLSFCELPFEEACLTFHETSRTVRTASSEQVRQPINRKGLDAWKPFENWLTPMREALQGSVDRYPEF
jgi:hypothetical protein